MYKIKYLIFTALFAFSACNKSKCIWHTIESDVTNLKPIDEEFNKIIIKNNDLYLLGFRDLSTNWTEMKSVIYKSTNYGRNWKNINLSSGNYINGFISDDNIYVVKENYKDNSFNNLKTSLIKFSDDFKTNQEIIQFKDKASIENFFLNKKNQGFLIVNNEFSSENYSIFKTSDGFKTYDSISFRRPIIKSYFKNDKIYLLSYKKNYLSNDWLYISNGYKIIDSLNIKFNVTDFVVEEKNNDILFLGKNGKTIEIRKNSGNKQITLKTFITDDQNLPESIYKYNNFIAVTLKKINSSTTTTLLFLSYDNGKSFEEEEIPINNFVKPISFYKDKKIIIYSGAGRISICNLLTN